MPANLPPQYFEVEEKYRQARTIEEKLYYLKEMLAVVPKHKGTEKLQKEIKTKISKLRKELGKKPKISRTVWYHFEKQGAGQIAVFGSPNSGKSSLVKLLTNANTEIAEYPFSTKTPIAGMMRYENIQIQLIDCPPLKPNLPPWYFHLLRSADVLLYLFDLSQDSLLEECEENFKILEEGKVNIFKKDEANYKKIIFCGNKLDCENSDFRYNLFLEFIRNYLPNEELKIIAISVKEKKNIEDLKRLLFESLEIIRVYTKPPGKPPELEEPIILKKNSNVLEAAKALHKDFYRNLKYARLWDNKNFFGQRVEKNHILKDGDIIEFHI
ncbi:MAG: 50S ribosome-binding GTPase [candidate division WOR-3 bacterium]|nr:50S ribosome-binding GTPase [candidate division WOR-3 bacterium]MCX7837137.1 50S ribosome-binding GTPase [candidate division WOR-3 bacterium]MDW8113654.1 GTPase [candidate division WOR-3 bacterium]